MTKTGSPTYRSFNYETMSDVAVIGGGMIGASVAYHCAKKGLSTILLEKKHLASAGSGGNFGLVLPSTGRFDLSFALTCEKEGVKRLENLKEELDFDIEYRFAHGYCLLCSDKEVEMFSMHRDRFVAAGFGERMITPEELWEFEPNLMKNRSIIAALQTDEAVLNPIRLVSGFACAGLRQGAKINNYSPVVDFKTDGHRIISIITEKGEFHADKIIIAAGSWSRQVALKLGISIPEYYIQAEAVVTEPLPLLLNGFVYWGNVERIPKEIELANEALTKGWESRGNENMFASYDFGTVQTKRGNVLLGQMSYITPPFDWHATHQVMPGSARETMKLLPQLKNARILRSWRSPAPFTPDHLPLLGKLDGFDNLYIASGFQSAVTGCPWAGEFVADLVSGSKISSGFEQYDPGRFKQPIAI